MDPTTPWKIQFYDQPGCIFRGVAGSILRASAFHGWERRKWIPFRAPIVWPLVRSPVINKIDCIFFLKQECQGPINNSKFNFNMPKFQTLTTDWLEAIGRKRIHFRRLQPLKPDALRMDPDTPWKIQSYDRPGCIFRGVAGSILRASAFHGWERRKWIPFRPPIVWPLIRSPIKKRG
jgi:hypothetical protein